LFPLMLSFSPSFVRVRSMDPSAVSPSRMLSMFSGSSTSGRTSGSWFLSCSASIVACASVSIVVFVADVSSPTSGRIFGSNVAGGGRAGRGHVPVVPCGRIGALRRSVLACFSAASATLIFFLFFTDSCSLHVLCG